MDAKRLKIANWLEKHGEEFYEAIGAWPGDEEMMVLLLSQLPTFLNGRFPLFKDQMAQQRHAILQSFLEGQPVNEADLRGAIALLLQSFSGAVNRVAALEEQNRRNRTGKPPMRFLPRAAQL